MLARGHAVPVAPDGSLRTDPSAAPSASPTVQRLVWSRNPSGGSAGSESSRELGRFEVLLGSELQTMLIDYEADGPPTDKLDKIMANMGHAQTVQVLGSIGDGLGGGGGGGDAQSQPIEVVRMLDELMDVVDLDGDGSIAYEEFVTMMKTDTSGSLTEAAIKANK